MPHAIIAPSLLSGDFANLASECQRMVDCGADWLHVDVMDGHFVPNLTLGAPIVKSIRQHTKAHLDCHLMVDNPEKWVEDFSKAGASGYTFHFEAAKNPEQLLKHIKNSTSMSTGVAVKPKTSVDKLYPLIDAGLIDMVLVMTVEPGFGGQEFMEDCMPKVQALRQKYPKLNIQVDGGLSTKTIGKAASAGANVIVAGTAIFKAEDPKATIQELRNAVDKQGH